MEGHTAWLFSAVCEVPLHSMKDKKEVGDREEVADISETCPSCVLETLQLFQISEQPSH